jgi:UDP:flavonoid glycosyltransferase YjiC (YdhE family)
MGTNHDHFDEVPNNIQVYESVDQMAVLSIADAFITHCGMNSASEGLYYGVPLVLFPQTPEQNAVATRTEELGAGVRLQSISGEDILDALTKVLEVPHYKECAGRVSESFKSCGGIEEAKEFLCSMTDNPDIKSAIDYSVGYTGLLHTIDEYFILSENDAHALFELMKNKNMKFKTY